MLDNKQNIELLTVSYMNTQIKNTIIDVNELSFQNIESILKEEGKNHYLCPKCHLFPFIEFTKSKNILN
jgi:hypothetical protein